MATWDTVEEVALSLPEAEPGTWAGTPAFKVRKKAFVRLKEEDVIVVFVSLDEKEALLQAEPDVFFTTQHYDGYPAFLVRLSAIDRDELEEVLIESWRRSAPKRVVRAFDAASGDEN